MYDVPAGLRASRLYTQAAVTPTNLTGAVFTRTGGANYFDVNGVLQTAATGVIRDAHYQSATRTFLLEAARTNVALHNRDLTNAAWVKTSVTAAKDQTGIDGVANAAASITATANAGTVLQTVVLASSVRCQSAYVKRLVGTGAVEMTTDNGTTWTPITLTVSWALQYIPFQTLANPVFGFRFATSGDSIAVDFVGNENGRYPSSPVEVAGVAATRNTDTLYVPYTNVPQALTLYVRGYDLGTVTAPASARLANIGSDSDPRFLVGQASGGGAYSATNRNTAGSQVQSVAVGAPTYGQLVETASTLSGSGVTQIFQSINGAAQTNGTATASQALEVAWSTDRLYINSGAGGSTGLFAFTHVIVVPGVRSLALMRSVAGVV